MKVDRVNSVLLLISFVLISSIVWVAIAFPESDFTPRLLFVLVASFLLGVVTYWGVGRRWGQGQVGRWIITVLTFFSALFFSGLLWQDNSRETIIAQSNCRRLEIGMSHQMVAEIMGSPKRVWFDNRDTPVEEHWVYFDDPIMSSQIACRFDSVSRVLIGFTCGD
jgi:hypothetical protein